MTTRRRARTEHVLIVIQFEIVFSVIWATGESVLYGGRLTMQRWPTAPAPALLPFWCGHRWPAQRLLVVVVVVGKLNEPVFCLLSPNLSSVQRSLSFSVHYIHPGALSPTRRVVLFLMDLFHLLRVLSRILLLLLFSSLPFFAFSCALACGHRKGSHVHLHVGIHLLVCAVNS